MLLFGGAQIIVSQIPDFHNMEWLSILAAIMSFSYSTIGLGLGFAKVIGNLILLYYIINNMLIFCRDIEPSLHSWKIQEIERSRET